MNLNLKAPNQADIHQLDLEHTVFLAGSITGARDWQKDATNFLLPYFNIFNPRRDYFDTKDESVEREQITWEFQKIALAEITLFYFSEETLAPITLLEYGKQLSKIKYEPFRKTYICIHPAYQRRRDILIQTELEYPQLLKNTFDDLGKMCAAIIEQNGQVHSTKRNEVKNEENDDLTICEQCDKKGWDGRVCHFCHFWLKEF